MKLAELQAQLARAWRRARHLRRALALAGTRSRRLCRAAQRAARDLSRWTRTPSTPRRWRASSGRPQPRSGLYPATGPVARRRGCQLAEPRHRVRGVYPLGHRLRPQRRQRPGGGRGGVILRNRHLPQADRLPAAPATLRGKHDLSACRSPSTATCSRKGEVGSPYSVKSFVAVEPSYHDSLLARAQRRGRVHRLCRSVPHPGDAGHARLHPAHRRPRQRRAAGPSRLVLLDRRGAGPTSIPRPWSPG